MKRYFRVELDFRSLALMTVLVNAAAGLILGIFIAVQSLLEGLLFGVVMGVPIGIVAGAFNGLLTSILAYPAYHWYCERYRGQPLSGLFLETGEEEQ